MANETTSRLTMIARGLGFEETAKSADVLAQAQARILDNQAKLAAAQQSGSIGDVGTLLREQEQLASVVDALGGAQERDNLRKQDYLKLLREINPQLAGFVDAGLSAVKVSGRLSEETLSLAGVTNFAKNAVTQYAGAFKLLAAGGLILAGLVAIRKAWADVAEETKRAEEAVKANNASYDETLRKRRDLQRSIEDISDKSREGGLNAAQSSSAVDAARRVRQQFPQLDESAVATAAALLPGADDQAIAEAAFLQQSGRLSLDPNRSAQSRQRAFGKTRQRHAGSVGAFFQREDAQTRAVRAALDEAQGRAGTTLNLEEFIRSIPGDAFAGREEDLAKAVAGLRDFKVESTLFGLPIGSTYKDEAERKIAEANSLRRFESSLGLRAGDANDARVILQQLLVAVERLNSGGPTVIQNNGRYIGADAASRRARTVNGESQRARIERE